MESLGQTMEKSQLKSLGRNMVADILKQMKSQTSKYSSDDGIKNGEILSVLDLINAKTLNRIVFPENFNDEYGVKRILIRDWISRKQRSWPLVPCSEFGNFKTITETEKELFSVTNSYYYRKQIDEIDKIPTSETNYIEALYKTFPQLKQILTKYGNKLAVCGGILARILTDNYEDSYIDVDIFFYNTNKDEALAILEDCVSLITLGALHEKVDNKSDNKNKRSTSVRIEHRLNVTNVIVFTPERHEESFKSIKVYQFIHRIYPTLDSIIGGFDLGPCMIAFDGKHIYGTELGAWSIMKKALIVDTTRRSTSFEYRIIKYKNMGFNVVFPGIDPNITLGRSQNELDSKYEKLIEFLKQNELRLRISPDEGSIRDFITSIPKHLELNEIKIHESKKRLLRRHVYFNKLIKETNGVIPDKILKRFSDYSSFIITGIIPNAIGTMLRCNNLANIFTFVSFETEYMAPDILGAVTHSTILKEFRKLYETPKLKHDGDTFHIDITYTPNYERRPLVSKFAEFAGKLELGLFTNRDTFCEEVENTLTSRLIENVEICEKNLTGINWITENPGRQWTSSINPIMESPREFYKQHYRPFVIGIPKNVETIFRLIMKRRKLLSKDLLGIVFQKLCMKLHSETSPTAKIIVKTKSTRSGRHN